MLSLSEKPIKKALFVSPIVDMKNIILHMMKRAKISEEELRLKKVINIQFGEPLSWKYLYAPVMPRQVHRLNAALS